MTFEALNVSYTVGFSLALLIYEVPYTQAYPHVHFSALCGSIYSGNETKT